MQAIPRCTRPFALATCLGVMALVDTISFGYPSQAATAVSPEAQKQIAAGVAIYKDRCVQCHSENLAGGAGPPLRGEDFAAQWDGKTMRLLYNRILMTMPGDDPGSLTPAQVLTLVSYIASENSLANWKSPIKSADDLTKIVMRNPK